MAELIKIVQPDPDIMIEDSNFLSESELDEEYRKIKAVIESENWKDTYKENFEEDYNKKLTEEADLIAMGIVAAIAIGAIIYKLITWLRGKYTDTVKKLLVQSKELNDIYTKVNDLLSNNRKVAFTHRNDIIDAEIHSAVMIDKKDPSKIYRLYIDQLVFNSDYFIKQLTEIINYSSSKSSNNEDRAETLNRMVDAIITNVDEYVMKNNGYIYTCEPNVKITIYKNKRLKEVVASYKEWVDEIYRIIDIYNKNISAQLQYLQILETAYKKMSFDYNKDKEAKAAIDKLFKYLLKVATASMDFNSKALVVLNEMIKYYSDALHKIYDNIRS